MGITSGTVFLEILPEKRFTVYCEIIFQLPLHKIGAQAIKKNYENPRVTSPKVF
jgi:hypothetical protein